MRRRRHARVLNRRDPTGEGNQSSGDGGDEADRRAVGDHDQADLAVCRPRRGEQAELTLAALGDDDERRRRHERDERHRHGPHDQHADRSQRLLALPALHDEPRGGRRLRAE